ncbi:MAG: hypothetical protein GY817_00205 [bacterium]|nr:hypothetical protein [bacterium]
MDTYHIDIIIGILVIISLFFGIYKGFLRIFFYLLAVISGGFISTKLKILLVDYIPPNLLGTILLYALTILIITIFLIIIGILTAQIFTKHPFLKVIDRLVGTFFSGFLLVMFLALIYQATYQLNPQLVNSKEVVASKAMQTINQFSEKVYQKLPESLQKKISDMKLNPYAVK